MKNVFVDYVHRNELSVSMIIRRTNISSSLIYRMLNTTNKDLLNMRVGTAEKLKRIGFDLILELKSKLKK